MFSRGAQSIHASDHHATLHGVVFDILVGSEHRVGLAAVCPVDDRSMACRAVARGRAACLAAVRRRASAVGAAPARERHAPVGLKTATFERARAMRTPRSFRSRNATYIIAVISASLKASCWARGGMPRSLSIQANERSTTVFAGASPYLRS